MHRTGFIAFVSILFFTLTLGQVCEDGGAEYGHGCLNNGVCELDPHDSTLYCSCQVDFTGDYCETEMLVCSDSVPCLNGGVCIESEAGNECNCAEGYTGYLCETEFDCESNDDCFNGGTCDDETNRCTCLSGVTGYHCERVFPTCNCSDTIECVNDVICPCCCEGEACVPEPVCEVDIEIGHGCLNGGVCTSDVDPTEFDYCQCPDGYTGDYCETGKTWFLII
uniref:Fibropellin-1-like n=1 Tax=Saccoglossus kowalevskii TaxID=10224 RepID=A0ABM0M7S0_SACKO|nr:PREDICTED: fibropellin-1-like [Saccoglossus kowalevskii]